MNQNQNPSPTQDEDGIYGTSGSYELAPTGNHLCRCVQVVLLGTIDRTYEGKVKRDTMIMLGWELIGQNDSQGKPFIVKQEYLLSMTAKANLFKTICSWAGKTLTPEAAKAFNIKNLLDFPAMVNVLTETAKSSGNEYTKVAAVTPAPTGVPIGPAASPLIFFNFNLPFKLEQFNRLTKNIQDKIKSSDEWAKLASTGQLPAELTGATVTNAQESTAPFGGVSNSAPF